MALQARLDLGPRVRRALFGISSPLRGDAVQLKLGAAGTWRPGPAYLPVTFKPESGDECRHKEPDGRPSAPGEVSPNACR